MLDNLSSIAVAAGLQIIRDNGVGGAYPGGGSGLVGLQDRVEALGGTIKIESSAGSGTCVVVTLPIATEPDQEIENFLGPIAAFAGTSGGWATGLPAVGLIS
jgi:hypothetical protein